MGSPPRDGGDSAAGVPRMEEEAPPQVDPFLVEALQNPRHRLTVLRIELDIQRFMQNHEQHQFEFQHFPSSYLRRVAHRVAQHYGLQTMVLDNLLDGVGRIAARKMPDSRYPSVRLSDIPAKQTENEKPEQIKIVLRTRPNRTSLGDAVETEITLCSFRTVEEREEEYDKARARIFNDFNNSEGVSSDRAADGANILPSREGTEGIRKVEEPDKSCLKDACSSVAIFKDRAKDLSDPDYDRSYDRYFRGLTPNQSSNLRLYNVFQPFCVQYEPAFSHLRQMPWAQTSVGHEPSNTVMSSSCYTAVCNQTSQDSVYVQWPSPAMMYAHSYEHFRNGFLQAPFSQQPLSFEHPQNH